MSWSMYVDIYVKKDNIWSTTDIQDKEFDLLKSLCEYRGSLTSDICSVSLDAEDLQALDKLQQSKQEDEFEPSGAYYDVSSFVELKKEIVDQFKELIVKKDHFDKLRQSLEYLRLSPDEKQNVLDEEDSVVEELLNVESKLEALTSIIAVLDVYAEYDEFAVAFIYSA